MGTILLTGLGMLCVLHCAGTRVAELNRLFFRERSQMVGDGYASGQVEMVGLPQLLGKRLLTG